MSINNQVTKNNHDWNSKKFIALSDRLSQGYGLGLNKTQSRQRTDSWNAEKFINMSRALSSAYGVDF